MNRNFTLFDKNNNLEKVASIIVKFNFEGRDFIIYSIDENEQNSQIFVSKFILNSEGKYFIGDILPEEKRKLNNIVYSIVILLPTEEKKGINFQSLIDNLFNKYSVKLSYDIPSMDTQEYYSNCSIAITSKILVESAVKLYNDNLNDGNDESTLIPTWTAPVEVTAPVEASLLVDNSVQNSLDSTLNSSVNETTNIPNLNLQDSSSSDLVLPTNIIDDTKNTVSEVSETSFSASNSVADSNPQRKKLAIVSDPSLTPLGINVQQPNVGKLKKAGFANTKYVVIGTVCLILAVAVIVAAYILIKNIK